MTRFHLHPVRSALPRRSLLLAAGLLVPWILSADDVHLSDGRVIQGTIRAIDAGTVTLDKTRFPLEQVKRLIWSAPPLPQSEGGLVLADGTVLHGVLHRVTRDRITFRSASAGMLDLPLEAVGGLFFDGSRDLPAGQGPKQDQVRLTLRNGVAVQGTLFAVTPTRVVIRSGEGLQQIDLAVVRYLAFRSAVGTPPAQLRNGDRLWMNDSWQGGTYPLKIDDTAAADLPLAAFQHWNLTSK